MDITNIVKEMIAAGMPEDEILTNLGELGVPEPEKVLAQAKAAAAARAGAKPAPGAAPQAQKAAQTAQPEQPQATDGSKNLFGKEPAKKQDGFNIDGSEKEEDLFSEVSEQDAGKSSELFAQLEATASTQAPAPRQQAGGTDAETGRKIDELLAISKSLLDLNKKILDSNRELLLKLSK